MDKTEIIKSLIDFITSIISLVASIIGIKAIKEQNKRGK